MKSAILAPDSFRESIEPRAAYIQSPVTLELTFEASATESIAIFLKGYKKTN